MAVCGDFEPPYGFGLLFFQFPLTALVILIGWFAGMFVTRRRSRPLSVLVPIAGAILVAWASIASAVPMNDAAFYADPEVPATRECGPAGVPTWWPNWIPI